MQVRHSHRQPSNFREASSKLQTQQHLKCATGCAWESVCTGSVLRAYCSFCSACVVVSRTTTLNYVPGFCVHGMISVLFCSLQLEPVLKYVMMARTTCRCPHLHGQLPGLLCHRRCPPKQEPEQGHIYKKTLLDFRRLMKTPSGMQAIDQFDAMFRTR